MNESTIDEMWGSVSLVPAPELGLTGLNQADLCAEQTAPSACIFFKMITSQRRPSASPFSSFSVKLHRRGLLKFHWKTRLSPAFWIQQLILSDWLNACWCRLVWPLEHLNYTSIHFYSVVSKRIIHPSVEEGGVNRRTQGINESNECFMN